MTDTTDLDHAQPTVLAWLAGRGPDARLLSNLPLPTPPTWTLPPTPGWT
ncbi:hypothetical protein [Streptomyces sp. NPDC093089]